MNCFGNNGNCKNTYRGSTISKCFQVEKNTGENTFLIQMKRRNKPQEVELSSGGVILRQPQL
jgi:hypothetical protein